MKKAALTALITAVCLSAVPQAFSQETPGTAPQTGTKNAQQQQSVRPVALASIQKALNTELKSIDQKLFEAVKKVAARGLTGDMARETIQALCLDTRFAFGCAVTDASGRILAGEPDKRYEGLEIGRQGYFVMMAKTLRPQLSSAVTGMEGFSGVVLARPVTSGDGALRGAVIMLIQGREMLSSIMGPLVQGMPVAISVMQTDGRMLYDDDPSQIGRIAFSDPLYERFTDLKKLAVEMTEKSSGSGRYTFFRANTGTVVNKEAFWETVKLHNTEWRIILTKEIETPRPPAGVGDQDAPWLEEAYKALGVLAADRALHKALADSDREAADAVFRPFAEKFKGVYSVQWVDVNGFNRFGYPAGNSLTDYDFNSTGLPRDKFFLDAVHLRKKTAFKLPLVEGGVGRFYVQPVFDADRYLGIIYFMVRP
ncbi:MAG: hypothetical protein WC889_12820 [Myxococcota bacterium]|jgi:hypothetical protein